MKWVPLAWRPALVAVCLLALAPACALAGEVGWIGVSITDVGEDLAERLGATFGPAVGNGVQVVSVLPGGPGEGALKRGDVIIRLGAQPIWDVRQLQRLVRGEPVNRRVVLGVLRESAQLQVPLVIGPMPAEARAALAGEPFGFQVSERDARDAEADAPSRVLVAFVEPESPAARAGLKPMDLILQVNSQPVETLADFERAADLSVHPLALVVRRRGATEPLPLRLDPGR